jgi:5'-AMP-activated protein kinase, regulatory gamma subunit
LLHLPLRKLGIGTYISPPPADEVLSGHNPYHPIATANMTTTVFDVVHMFSERGISAVPIVDEDGVVVNLYETVDVIVRRSSFDSDLISKMLRLVDTRAARCLPVT